MSKQARRVFVEGFLILFTSISVIGSGIAHAATGGATLNDFFSLSPPELSWQQIFNSEGIPISLPDGSGAELFPDNISAGIATDMTALFEGKVVNDTLLSQNDLGNTYLYYTTNQSGDLIVYAGISRLAVAEGESFIEITVSQSPFYVRQGNPWPIFGSHTPGDLAIKLNFAGGNLTSVDTSLWTEGENQQTVDSSWPIAGAACSGQPDSFAFCIGDLPPGLPPTNQDVWDRFYQKVQVPQANQFVEVGINISKLIGIIPTTLSLTVKTPEDIVLAPMTIKRRAQP